MLVTFGGIALPHVLSISTEKSHEEIERFISSASVPYRADRTSLGISYAVTGEIREETISAAAAKIELLRRLADGVEHLVDLLDGSTAFFDALLCDPEFEIVVVIWIEGKYYVPYSVTLLKVT